MINKVTLTYENHEYIVKLGEAVLVQEKDEEKAIIAFKNAIKNNTATMVLSFEEMLEKIKRLHLKGIEVNETYKTMEYGEMKYFYHTGKVFYTGEGKMVLLLGGFDYFYKVLSLVDTHKIVDGNEFIKLCAIAIEKDATYNISEDEINISSAGFSYGNVGFNFTNHKLNKGTSSEKSTFDIFKKLVVETL